jgi:hypothetical protein
MSVVRVVLAAAAVFVFGVAACGTAADRVGRDESGRRLAGLGIAVELPGGWHGRIVLGSTGRPVLHAANYLLPANDDDVGSVAQSIIGSRGHAYLNVQELGPADGASALPVSFGRDDFGAPPEDGRGSFATAARREVLASGRAYRVTVTSGSDERPSPDLVAEVNAILAALAFEPYEFRPMGPRRAGERLAGRGIEVRVPSGWSGRLSDGELMLASFDTAGGDREARNPPAEELVLRLREQGGTDAPFVTARLPIQLVPTEFVPPESGETGTAESGRSFVVSGRQFVLWVSAGSPRPSPDVLAEANDALASLEVEPGDFYLGQVEPGDFYLGQVEPATFEPSPDWHSGTGGPTEIEPSGEATYSWASTIPYQNQANEFPPSETLDALPPDGIAIVLWLERWPSSSGQVPVEAPALELGRAQTGSSRVSRWSTARTESAPFRRVAT